MAFISNLAFVASPRPPQKYRLSNILAVGLSLMAVASIIATYFVLTGTTPSRTQNLLPWVYFNFFLLLALIILVARRVVELWREQRKNHAGSQIHSQLVGLFSFVAIITTVVMFIFSTFYLNKAVQAWFGDPVRAALDEAHAVAQAYLKEHISYISQDAKAMVLELRPYIPHLLANRDIFNQVLTRQGEILNLREALVLNDKQQVIARSQLTFALQFEKTDLAEAIDATQKTGDVIVLENEAGDRVRALVKLDPNLEIYLYIGKRLSPAILKQLTHTQSAIANYHLLEEQRAGLQTIFMLFFSLVALLLLLAVIWVGLTLANILVRPISKLIKAAEEVSQGNLSVRVILPKSNNEIDKLTVAFNHMTSQLEHQRRDLIKGHEALLSAQRKAAWSDEARKIAHEIKNPLTPIQLSAERLKRKYLREIKNDPETFQACIDTIIRQVSHIGSLVSEFSDFARIPEPEMQEENLNELCKQAYFLQKEAYQNISFTLSLPEQPVLWLCDHQQIGQALTNLLQNSVQAIRESEQKHLGRINLALIDETKSFKITVEDNGPGFPLKARESLVQPYFTTRRKGTGLGLAIVAKIITDHGGQLILGESPSGGAKVELVFQYGASKGVQHVKSA